MLLDAAVKPVGKLLGCQVVLLSFEVSMFKPVAVTLAIPVLSARQLNTEGSPLATFVRTGDAVLVSTTIAIAIDIQRFMSFFTIEFLLLDNQ